MTEDKLIKTLADIGFMATSAGMSKHAFGIFSAIESARPDNILSSLGFAMAFINKKMYPEALEILHKEATPKDPDHPALKAFIGMALMLEGRNKESENYLLEVSASEDAEAASMAKELLTDIQKG